MTRIGSVNHARRGVLHVARAVSAGLNQRICDVGGQCVRFGGASDRPIYPVGCGGAQVPPHTPTASHKHRSQCAVGVQNRSQEGVHRPSYYVRYTTIQRIMMSGWLWSLTSMYWVAAGVFKRNYTFRYRAVSGDNGPNTAHRVRE